MAEVIDIPGINTLTEPADYERLGYERRHSTGKIMIPPRIRAKVLSRYMKAPIGSCHDNCKSGLKPGIEQKQRPPIPMRTIRAPKARGEVQNVENMEADSVIITRRKSEASPRTSSARDSQETDGTSIRGTNFEGHDLKMNATTFAGCDESEVVYASSDVKDQNHGDPTLREGQDVEVPESGLADKQISLENYHGPSNDSNLLEPDDSVVSVPRIDREGKTLEAATSSLQERKISSENNQKSSSDTYAQEVNRPQVMAMPFEVSTLYQEKPTTSIAEEQLETDIDLKPSESKIPEGDIPAVVTEKASEQCQSQVVDADERNLEEKRNKKQGVHYNPLRHSKSHQSVNQTSIRKNSATVTKPDINSQLQVPSFPKKAYVPRRNSRGSTMKASTPVYVPKHASVTDKGNLEGIKGEETCSPMNSEELSGCTSKDDHGPSKDMMVPMIRKKGSQVLPSVSSRELDKRASAMNAKGRGNLKKVPRSEKNANNIKVETRKLNGNYRLKNQGAVEDEVDVFSNYPPEKTLHVIETEPENRFMTSEINNVHGNNMSISSSPEANSFEKNNRRVPTGRSPPHSENKNVRRRAANASQLDTSSSRKNTSWRKIQDGFHNHHLSSSTLLSVESLKSSLHSCSSGHKKTNNDKKPRTTNMRSVDKPLRSRLDISNNKQRATETLSFKRGKVIELHPVDQTPKRLKFRKRVLHDQGSGDGLKGKGDLRNIAEKRIYVPKGTASGSNSEKVVLRRQNAETKKNSASLFNNVIEETTNKLVKSRSKVKALVTAFETVISLQDIKPSPTATVN